MSQDIDQTIADTIAQRIETTLAGMPPKLAQISDPATTHGDGVRIALDVLADSTRVIVDAAALFEAGFIDHGDEDRWADQGNGAAIDAAGRVGMDIDGLEELAGY